MWIFTVLLVLKIVVFRADAGFRFNQFQTCDPGLQSTLNSENLISMKQVIFINNSKPVMIDRENAEIEIGLLVKELGEDRFSIFYNNTDYLVDLFHFTVSENNNTMSSQSIENPARIYFLCDNSISALVLIGPQDKNVHVPKNVGKRNIQDPKSISPKEPKEVKIAVLKKGSAIYILFGFTFSLIFGALGLYWVVVETRAKNVPDPDWPAQIDSDSEEENDGGGLESSLFSAN